MKSEGFGAGKGAKKRKNGAKVLMIVLISVFTLIVVAGIGAWIYFKTAFNRMILPDTVESVVPPGDESFVIDDTDTEPYETYDSGTVTDIFDTSDDRSTDSQIPGGETTEHAGEIDPGKVEWPDAEGLGDDGLINILIVGQDTSSFKKRSRTDTMLLVSVNPNTGGISMISFLRDLYVQIGKGYSDNRMNTAYVYGGFDHLFYVMKVNFGITCDYGVVVNFASFMNIIDMLGGVEVELTQKEVNYLKNTVPGAFPDLYPDAASVKVSAGKNLLPSPIALTYARARKLDSDFGRTGRQRKVMLSIYNRFKTADLATIINIVNTVTGISRPGEESWVGLYKMTEGDLINLVTKLYPLLGNEIKGYSVPAKGSYKYATIRGMSIILPDLVKIRNDLKNQLPLDENHSIPAATTKKVTTPAPETTKIPETSATGEITDPAPSTESVNDTFTDPPVTSDDTPATVTDIESSILSEETTAPVSDTEGGGELTEATETTVPEETVPPDGADSSASA